MARNITHEPSTLVYTLLDESKINFDDFYLIVRSLHSYMVDSIVPNPEHLNVHVKLNYQASVSNAQQKLGALQSAVGVTKLSSHINESEFSRLEQLRRRFGVGIMDPEPVSRAAKPRGGYRRTVRGRPRIFAQRPAPYPVVEETDTEYPDAQEFLDQEATPSHEYS